MGMFRGNVQRDLNGLVVVLKVVARFGEAHVVTDKKLFFWRQVLITGGRWAACVQAGRGEYTRSWQTLVSCKMCFFLK
ncbi:hypothetical protein IF1G_10877 [Cordyceps javanica]|uniref:Uncharacterized protein n=1 Tax=Cordyceps javanica TaxID=43265 RepID=A0A545ULQ6_9HYPO|nr:hypothetical protein IF1G_10877 [Cordyceps javanica]